MIVTRQLHDNYGNTIELGLSEDSVKEVIRMVQAGKTELTEELPLEAVIKGSMIRVDQLIKQDFKNYTTKQYKALFEEFNAICVVLDAVNQLDNETISMINDVRVEFAKYLKKAGE